MKLTFPSLDATLAALRESRVAIVWISPAVEREDGAWTAGIPYLTSRVIVTAVVDERLWAEWRYWVGRAMAEGSDRDLRAPAWLQAKGDRALAEVSKRVDDSGFEIREGMICHDRVAIDTFRL